MTANRRVHRAVSGVALLITVAACTRREQAPAPPTPRVAERSSGPVTARLIVDPPEVQLDRDTLLTIQVSAPSNFAVRLPAVEGRVEGLATAGLFDREPRREGSQRVYERCVRLTPHPAPRHRIAPMAIRWQDPASGEGERWFPTPPLVLAVRPLVSEKPRGVADIFGPVRVRPGVATLLTYTLVLLLLLAAACAPWLLGRRLQRYLKLRRLSPKERALWELEALLARDLPGKGRVKEFYFDLTMIVRRYIERAHGVRAPEQTTEEFLQAVSQDSRFAPQVVARLRDFLSAADLVKYAAVRPEPQAVTAAIATARHYIETDAVEQSRRQQEGHGAG